MTYSKEQKDTMADQMWEAAAIVGVANTGEKRVDIGMYQACSTELAFIAKCIAEIRAKGFGIDIQPNTFTK